MKMLCLENLSKALERCLQITFVAGLFITIFLSFILRKYFGWYYWNDERYYWACVILMTPCGLCSLNILWQLSSLMKTIHNKNPFVRKNVICLKRVAFSCFTISFLFFVLQLFHATLLTAAIAYIFLIAGFSFLVFGELIQKAVEYKNENDMTI